jgi:elongation factor 1-gamma
MTTVLTVLNNHLASRTFMVGNAVTLADITIATALVHLYSLVFTSKFLAPFVNVTRWFTTCINQPEFAKVIGKVEFAKEEAQPPKSAKADKKDEKKPAAAAAEKPAKAEKPAAAVSSSAPPKGEHDDLLDDEDKPKPKKKNPLDDLPASSMDMDTTKKLAFSARPFLPDFFEKLFSGIWDDAGYVWFTCEYNYNSDNKEYWKIGNSLGGFIQRSDACRKYAMGTIQASGPVDEEGPGPWNINGAWLFRGQDMLAEMKEENPDSEYYTWTKVDVKTEAGQKKVKEYFMGDTVNGLKVLDRRFFK